MERVRIVSGTHGYEGILLPSMREGILLLKLDNGYNIGIREKGSKVTVLKRVKEDKVKLSRVQQKKELPKIIILHTGGTIASRVDYETGAVIARFTPEEIITMFPELQKIANVDSKLLRNMWSGDMRFAHYNIMTKAVAAEKNVKGIIITHGTDTMGYSAAALSFMLEGLDLAVILVGAQRSSDRGSSDAAVNLVCAAHFITKTDFKGVAICMHEGIDDEACVILPPCKTKKLHSSRRDAFKAVNVHPIARVTKEGAVTWISRPKESSAEFKLTLMNEKLKVGIVKFHPNFFSAELEHYKTFDGLIIEGTGLGNGPVDVIDKETKEHDKILKTIGQLAKKMPVAMTTQCVFGTIDMNVYAYGRKLQQAGVIGNGTDMLTETAFVKLAWLLSNHKKNVKELYVKNLRGELT